MKEITPEEKLLRLIKSKKNITEKSIEKPKEIIKKEAISNTFTAKTKIPKDKKESLIGNLSIALIFLLIATAIYFIVDFLVITPYSRHKLNNIELESKSPIDEKTISPKEAPKKESIKPYSYYSENIANRDIFRPLVQKEGKVLEGGVSKIREKFNLTGIISGDKLQAAIEDKVGKRTYFVYKGEYIEDVLVEDILENKVILNYKGEKFELML